MRKLTIEILADQPRANWIWESHSELSFMHGIKVVGISEGHASITAVGADAETLCACEKPKPIWNNSHCQQCGMSIRTS